MFIDRPDNVLSDAAHSCHGLQPYWPASLDGMPLTDGAVTPFDDLFNALDGRAVAADDRTWRLHLYSVRELNNAIWIQLDVVGTPTYVLTIRQPRTVDATGVVATVQRYLEATKDAPDAVVFDRILSTSVAAVQKEAAFAE
jgi:hypothetical protein